MAKKLFECTLRCVYQAEDPDQAKSYLAQDVMSMDITDVGEWDCNEVERTPSNEWLFRSFEQDPDPELPF